MKIVTAIIFYPICVKNQLKIKPTICVNNQRKIVPAIIFHPICVVKRLAISFLQHHRNLPDWKSCSERLASVGIMGAQLRASLKALKHHSTAVRMGFKGALIGGAIMPRGESLSPWCPGRLICCLIKPRLKTPPKNNIKNWALNQAPETPHTITAHYRIERFKGGGGVLN